MAAVRAPFGPQVRPQRFLSVELITAILFERPLHLGVVLAVVLFVLLRIWARHRTPRSRRAVWIGLAACPLLMMVQRLVVTDRERLVGICRELVWAVEDGNVPGIAIHLAESFDSDGLDKAGFLSAVAGVLRRAHVEDSELREFSIALDHPGLARVQFVARARLSLPEEIGQAITSAWAISFESEAGRWRVVRIDPVPTPQFPMHRLSELLRG